MRETGKSLFGIGPGSELPLPVRAFRTLLIAAQRLRYLMDEQLRPDGLTTQQAALITVVLASDRPSMTAAAAALGTTHQNVAQLVTSLERKGFLAVEADPTDRRRRRLVATAANARYWQARDERDVAAVAEWFARLSTDELETLCALLDRVLGGSRGSSGAGDRES